MLWLLLVAMLSLLGRKCPQVKVAEEMHCVSMSSPFLEGVSIESFDSHPKHKHERSDSHTALGCSWGGSQEDVLVEFDKKCNRLDVGKSSNVRIVIKSVVFNVRRRLKM